MKKQNTQKKPFSILSDETKKLINNTVESLLNAAIKINQTTLEGFMALHSDKIDALILRVENQERLSYVAGYAVLKTLSETKMQLEFELYFQDIKQQWICKNLIADTVNIHDYLVPESANKLLDEQQIRYDVEKPVVK